MSKKRGHGQTIVYRPAVCTSRSSPAMVSTVPSSTEGAMLSRLTGVGEVKSSVPSKGGGRGEKGSAGQSVKLDSQTATGAAARV